MLTSFKADTILRPAPFIASIPGYFLGELPGGIFCRFKHILHSQETQECLKCVLSRELAGLTCSQ